jgi:hypothetical protein
MYEGSLELQGIGLDILGNIDDKVLSGIGISMGDIIRIKKGSTIWWNGPNAKRKRSNTSTSSGTEHGQFGSPKAEPPKKRLLMRSNTMMVVLLTFRQARCNQMMVVTHWVLISIYITSATHRISGFLY